MSNQKYICNNFEYVFVGREGNNSLIYADYSCYCMHETSSHFSPVCRGNPGRGHTITIRLLTCMPESRMGTFFGVCSAADRRVGIGGVVAGHCGSQWRARRPARGRGPQELCVGVAVAVGGLVAEALQPAMVRGGVTQQLRTR